MRAIFLDNVNNNDEVIIISGASFHHLVNSVRIKIKENVLVLDGKGLQVHTSVAEISKRELQLLVIKSEIKEKKEFCSLAIGVTDRIAMEEIIRLGTEIGFDSIQPIITDYSKNKMIKKERINKIIVSAMIQSNNPFLINILDPIHINEFLDNIDPRKVICFSSQKLSEEHGEKQLMGIIKNKPTILIGPEGGFSKDEESEISRRNIMKAHFKGNILRAQTAVSFSAGFIGLSQQYIEKD